MAIDASLVKQLRDKTGAGFMDCKKALLECEGDFEKSVDHLRAKGLALAARKAEREASEGLVGAYIHGGNKIGVLLEVNCETDFVANTDEFRALVHEVAMQVAAMDPAVVAPADRADRPELEGADEEVALLSQPWVKDGSKTIGELVQDAVARTGENIRVRRFARFELGG